MRRTGGAAALVSATGPPGYRQVEARLGVPQVHRRPRRDRLLAPRALARRTASGITFWALGEMVRERSGLAERTTSQRRAPDRENRRQLDPGRAGASLGRGVAARPARRSRPAGRRAGPPVLRLAHVLRAARRHNPVVMVFEDLQWADSGLLAFIDHLVEWSRGVPIYVVALARPELLETRPDWGAGKRNFTSLTLEPLSPEAMRALLAGLVPGLSAAAATRIVARADGVPLYAVEIVRMLVAQGSLEAADGVYRPVGDLADLAVPETLHSLIAARLDGLEPADRALLQARRGAGPHLHGGRPGRRRGARRRRRGAAPAVAGSPGARRPRPGPAIRRARPVRVRPVARSRGRLCTRSRGATASPATSRRPAISRRSWTRSWPGRSRTTTWLPTATPSRARRPRRLPHRRGSRCGRPGTGRSRWARRSRRWGSTVTRSR